MRWIIIFGGKVVEGDIFPTITRSYGRASGNGGIIKCKEGYRVLTPRERWRLMGFDDEDYDKAAKVNSDTQLNHQAGNSIVVNVLEAIIRSLFSEDRIYKQNKIINNTIKALLIEYKDINDERSAIKEFWTPNGSFTLMLEKFEDLQENIGNKYITDKGIVRYNCIKLLEAIIIKYSEDRFKTSTVSLSIKELLKLFERKGMYDLSKELKQYLAILKSIRIRIRSDNGKYVKFKLCEQESQIVKGKMYFKLSNELYERLKGDEKYIYMPSEVLKSQNTNLMYTGIVEHKMLNMGTAKENIIEVKELYEYLTLKGYKQGERHFERIRKNFETALNSIRSLNWKYDIDINGRYKTWIQAKIMISWKNTAPYMPIITESIISKNQEEIKA